MNALVLNKSTSKVVQGDPKKFRLTERVGPDSMKLQVVEELDREMESFYLLEITVSVCTLNQLSNLES